MKKLLKNFKNFSRKDKAKVVIAFPILLLTVLLDIVVDGFIFVFTEIRSVNRLILILVVFISIVIMSVALDGNVRSFKGKSNYDAEMYVYKNCHEMSNLFIVPEDGAVRGYKWATKDNIDKIISVIATHDMENGQYLISTLYQFRNGNYKRAVVLHNYCWTKLDGDVGYAVRLKSKYK